MSSVRVYRLRLFSVFHDGYALHVLRGNNILFINSPLLRFVLPLLPRLCALDATLLPHAPAFTSLS